MARYLYIGPPEERGSVPSWGFDDGVLEPGHLNSLVGRGYVRDLTVSPAEGVEVPLGAVAEITEDGTRIVAEAGSPEAAAFLAAPAAALKPIRKPRTVRKSK